MTYIEIKWSLWWFENIILLNGKNIDYNGISRNPNLTLKIFGKYPNVPWNWGYNGISSNPNLTLEILEKYPIDSLLKRKYLLKNMK